MGSVNKVLTADVANGGTVTVNYNSDMSYPKTTGHYLSYDNNIYEADDSEITVTLGDTSATITNGTGITWLKGDEIDVELIEPENIKTVPLSQDAYDALSTKDEDILYVILETT